jgi:hypothetical protein
VSKLSAEELYYIPVALGLGQSLTTIARDLGRGRLTVTRAAAEAGLSWKGKVQKSPLTAAQWRKVRESVPVIGVNATARKFDIHPSVVCRLAKRFGVKSPLKWGGSRQSLKGMK